MPATQNSDPAERAIVVQTGARHNYAVPAALEAAGRLEALYTDLAGTNGLGRVAASLKWLPLPANLKKPLGRLAGRLPPPAVAARTHTFDAVAARYEIATRQAPDMRGRIKARQAFNAAWSEAMLARGFGEATHIYTMMSGQILEGERFLQKAREAGLEVVVDVTIALSAEHVITEQYATNPGWGDAPDTYLGAMGRPNPAYPKMLEIGSRFLCASQYVADDLIENWGADPAKVRVEPYSVHPSWLELENRPQIGRILFPGSANLRKGIHHFARTAQLLGGGSDYEFRAVGDVATETRSNPEAAMIDFRGRIARPEMVQEYQAADIVVLPTLAEGSAGVTYEAMASGIPVITTRESGSLIKHGENGLIVPGADPQALAQAIETLVKDRELRDRMAANARQSIAGISWGGYSDRLVRAIFDKN
ncbi:glycosyltransferase family 4 protein [Erythrobacter sp. MTPC3]|uniref:glycosyltransferase family 4 protein n=1 Tax=Erythrobacter sp. MTPC3 TaxID=3056564 RepID=UPI0036F342F7